MITDIQEQVTKELECMKEVGVNVSDKVFRNLGTEDFAEYDNMGISEIADLMLDLYN